MMFTADDSSLRHYIRKFGRVHDAEESDDSEDDDSSSEDDEDNDDDNDDEKEKVEQWRYKSAAKPRTNTQSELLHYFAEVKQSPLNNWLLASDVDAIRAKYEIGASYPVATMKYFREVCNDVKHWLQQQEQHKVIKVTEFQPNDADERVRVLQQAVTRYFHSVAASSHMWLMGQGQDQGRDAVGEDLPVQLCSHDESTSKLLRNWSPFGNEITTCARLRVPVDNVQKEASPFTCLTTDSAVWLHPCRRSSGNTSSVTSSASAYVSMDQWLLCEKNKRSFVNGATTVAGGVDKWLHPCYRTAIANQVTAASDSLSTTPYHWTLCAESNASATSNNSYAHAKVEEKDTKEIDSDDKDCPKVTEELASPFTPHQHNVKNLNLSEWLHPSRLPRQMQNSSFDKCVNLQQREDTCHINSDWTVDWVVMDTKTEQTEEDSPASTKCSQAASPRGAWCWFDDEKQDVDAWLLPSSKTSAGEELQCANLIKLTSSGLQWSSECRR